jgi:hypothetical protein
MEVLVCYYARNSTCNPRRARFDWQGPAIRTACCSPGLAVVKTAEYDGRVWWVQAVAKGGA